MNDGSPVGGFILLILLVVLYFLPSFVAGNRERSGGVVVLNIFLGWTLIGWVVALAWAASLPKKDEEQPQSVGQAGEASPTEPDTKTCPFCAEEIKAAAIVCKHCGRELGAS